MGFPGLSGKESVCQCRRCRRCGFSPWVGKIPWNRKWQPTPVSLPGKFHRQRNLAGYSPWGLKELGTPEKWSTHIYIAQELCSMLCNGLHGERVWRRVDIWIWIKIFFAVPWGCQQRLFRGSDDSLKCWLMRVISRKKEGEWVFKAKEKMIEDMEAQESMNLVLEKSHIPGTW